MMERNDTFHLMEIVAARGLRNQVKRDTDYMSADGLLICGVCGEARQKYLNLPITGAEGQKFERRLKVVTQCKCDRQAIEQEEKHRKAEFELERIHNLRKASLIDDRFTEATFDKFQSNRFNERNLRLCRRYADKFDLMIEKNQGLLLWGGVGTGKTFAAACIANELLGRKIPVLMTSFVRLLSLIQSGEEKDVEIVSRMEKAKLVIFDDLGAERGTDYALEKVYSIVDGRYRQKLPMIFTTNLTITEMEQETDQRYSRIYDRVFEICYPMQFSGTSWRRREAAVRYSDMEKILGE